MDTNALAVRDALVVPVCLFVNGLLIHFAHSLSGLLIGNSRPPQLALAAVLIYIAAIVGATTMLGSCGLLIPWLLMAFVAIVSTAGISMLPLLRLRWVDAAHGADGEAKPVTGPEKRESVSWIWGAWFLLGGCLVAYIVVNGLFTFPTEFDSLAYHIPLIDHWLQACSLYAPDAAWWWTPANAEVMAFWMVAPFSGDFLIALGNFPFLLLWALAAVETGRLIELSVVWRHLAALAMVAIHTTFHEAEKAMNDLPVAACFFAAAAFGLRYLRSQRIADLALAGVAIGLLAGVKYFALGYAAVSLLAIVSATAVARGQRCAIGAGALMATAATPFGGYWYLRNYLAAGSPLFPEGVGSPGIGYPNLWQSTLVGNSDPELLRLAARALWMMTGPCHVVAIVLLPIVVVAVPLATLTSIRCRKWRHGAVLCSLCVLLLGSAVVFACTPFAVEDQPGTLNHLRWAYTPARYGLCFLSTAVLASIWLVQRVAEAIRLLCGRWLRAEKRWDRLLPTTAQALVSTAIVWQLFLRVAYLRDHASFGEHPDLIGAGLAGINMCAYGWLLCVAYRARPQYKRAFAAAAAISLLIVSSCGAVVLSGRWHKGFPACYDALRGTRVFAHLARRPAQTIAVLDHHTYPFFGSARQHRVASPRILTTYDHLIQYLAERTPHVVAAPRNNTGLLFDRYKQAPEWLRAHDSQFKPLLRSGAFSLFSFVDSEGRRGSTNAGDSVAYTAR